MRETNLQPVELKRRQARRAERHDARKFIEPVQANVRESFRNTGNSEQVADYFEATPRSTSDVVVKGHGDHLELLDQRVAAVERKLGMGRASSSVNRLSLVPQRKGVA